MDFWENLSTGTKGAIIIGALLFVVIVIVRVMEPDAGPEIPPGIPPGMTR